LTVAPSLSIFDSPSQPPQSSSATSPTPQPKPSTSPSSSRTTSRASPISSRRRPPGSRLGQSVISKLEDLDLQSDPLGPLGETTPNDTVAPPPPPAKDDSRTSKQPATTFAEIKADLNEPSLRGQQRAPSVSRQLSMPLEQAAQPPTFRITVGDPTTIGGIAGSHTEYKVRTKVLPFSSGN